MASYYDYKYDYDDRRQAVVTIVLLDKEKERRRSLGWTTKDGRIIPYNKIEDDHLKHIYHMLQKTDSYNYYILEEMRKRGFLEHE